MRKQTTREISEQTKLNKCQAFKLGVIMCWSASNFGMAITCSN